MTRATDNLLEAIELMKEAEKLINEAYSKNESLKEAYGTTLKTIKNALNEFSDNSAGYLTRNTCLLKIVEAQGEDWDN